MPDLPEILKQGEVARLFPASAETARERRITAMFLAMMTAVPALGERMLGSLGVTFGKRTRVSVFTEVVLAEGDDEKTDQSGRPDGLILIEFGSRKMSILVEAKIGHAPLRSEQVARYLDLARLNDIDMVLTLSNEFTASPDHSPVTLPVEQLRNARLMHWSWSWIATETEMLIHEGNLSSLEKHLIGELLRFMDHPQSGLERFTQMPESWKDLAQRVSVGDVIRKSDKDANEIVAAWFEQSNDVALDISRKTGRRAAVWIPRKHRSNPRDRLNAGIEALCKNHCLQSLIRIPEAAGDLELSVQMAPKTATFSMRLTAPEDIMDVAGRMKWLLDQIPNKTAPLFIRAHWPNRILPSQESLAVLVQKPKAIDRRGGEYLPVAFDVFMTLNSAKRFLGRRTFVEDLRSTAFLFWDETARHLTSWSAPDVNLVMQDETEDAGREEDTALAMEVVSDGECPNEAVPFLLGYLEGIFATPSARNLQERISEFSDRFAAFSCVPQQSARSIAAGICNLAEKDIRQDIMNVLIKATQDVPSIRMDVFGRRCGFLHGCMTSDACHSEVLAAEVAQMDDETIFSNLVSLLRTEAGSSDRIQEEVAKLRWYHSPRSDV